MLKKVKLIITIFILILVTFSFIQIVEAQILPLQPEADTEAVAPQPRTGSPEVPFTPQIGIGGDFQVGKEIKVSGRTFANYIVTIYNWALRALVLLAIVVIIGAGFTWIMAAGNASSITKAKDKIMSSLLGLLIGTVSYLLLTIVNPEIVHLRDLDDYNLNDQIETSHFTVGASTVGQCGGPLNLIQIITGEESTRVAQDWYVQKQVYNIKTNACYPDLGDCTEKYIALPNEIPDLKMEDINFIAIKMGVDSNAELFCNIKALDEIDIKKMTSGNNWLAMIVDQGTDTGGFNCNAAGTIIKQGAAIKIRACFGDEAQCKDLDYNAKPDDLLKGFSLILTDKSVIGKGAFFYYEYIDIYTNICCGTGCETD